MSSERIGIFTKENLNTLLKELAKEFKRRNGTAVPAEIILIGGAAVLVGYGFREMTTDVDAVIHASSVMKEAAGRVGDKYNLPHGWLNSDLMHTDSIRMIFQTLLEFWQNMRREEIQFPKTGLIWRCAIFMEAGTGFRRIQFPLLMMC